MRKKNPTISIAIPTHEAGESLVIAIRSILNQSIYSQINKIIVIVDGKQISSKIREKIRHKKVTVVQSSERLGQSKRLQDIFQLATSDLLVVTNDDVVLQKNALSAFLHAYKINRADFFSGEVAPLPGKSIFKRALGIGYEINITLVSLLKGKTYLTANGRLLALTKRLYKKIVVPERVQNNDAYVYFYAKLKGYGCCHVPRAKAYFHSPATLYEYMKQSYKFQFSQKENQQYFKQDLQMEYRIPKRNALLALMTTFINKPILTTGYMTILIYSRLVSVRKVIPHTGVWETDLSTKSSYII